ncbi:MAG: hypothetical protein CMJ62_15080 [Planctomycetaceae bacterium]|nr:hypothetical protein [Planctomycetaceae bacterium]
MGNQLIHILWIHCVLLAVSQIHILQFLLLVGHRLTGQNSATHPADVLLRSFSSGSKTVYWQASINNSPFPGGKVRTSLPKLVLKRSCRLKTVAK